MVWVWIVAGICALLVLMVGWVWWQYRRFRKLVPQATYRMVPKAVPPQEWSDGDVTICWIGHSTLYINIHGIRVLTDPVFSQRAGISLAGLRLGVKRHTSPALSLEDVAPHVDVILLSHAHMDHMDIPSLKQLANPRVQVVTAKGTKGLLRRMRFGGVTELEGRSGMKMRSGLSVRAVPVRHWGARFPWNKQYGWTGYLLECNGTRIFFAGDTAYTPTFAELAAEGNGPDIACIPIGAYSPDSFQGSHCTPEQAWRMFLDTGARWMVPIHWDTFVLSQEPIEEPMTRLLQAAGDDADKIVVRAHGDRFSLPGHHAAQRS